MMDFTHEVFAPFASCKPSGPSPNGHRSRKQVMAELGELAAAAIRTRLNADQQMRVEQDPGTRELVLQVLEEVMAQEHQRYMANVQLGYWPEGTDREIAMRVFRSIYSLGPVDALLEREDVEDIALNGPNEIYYRTSSGWFPAEEALIEELTGDSEAETLRFNTVIREQGTAAGPQQPIVDARLPEGHRLSIVAAPVTRDATPCVVVRKHRDISFSLEDFVSQPQQARDPGRYGQPLRDLSDIWQKDAILTPGAAAFLQMAIMAELNILVLGRTGVGKTAFLSMLGSLIPPERRVLVIEDTRELKIRQGERPGNCVYFTTVARQAEGGIDIPMHTLIKTALRQRPDHLILGEARGPEMWDLIHAMKTGHGGNLTSIHAVNAREVVDRVGYMIRIPPASIDLPLEQVSRLMATTFHLFVTYLMPSNGRRHIAEICALNGEITSSGLQPVLETVFLGGEERGYVLQLQIGHSSLEPHFSRIGHSFDEIVALDERVHGVRKC